MNRWLVTVTLGDRGYQIRYERRGAWRRWVLEKDNFDNEFYRELDDGRSRELFCEHLLDCELQSWGHWGITTITRCGDDWEPLEDGA